MDHFCNQSWCLYDPEFPDFPDEPFWPDEPDPEDNWDEDGSMGDVTSAMMGPTPRVIRVFDACTLGVAGDDFICLFFLFVRSSVRFFVR